MQPKTIFVSTATKIAEDATNILKCYFSKQMYPLTRHLHVENEIYLTQKVFMLPSLL